MQLKKYRYHAETIGANLHEVVAHINTYHPDWDVVSMHYVFPITCVVYREEIIEANPADDHARLLSAAKAAYHVLNSSPHEIGDGQDVDQLVEGIRNALTELQPFIK